MNNKVRISVKALLLYLTEYLVNACFLIYIYFWVCEINCV
jgi:hypothetical protein